MTSVTELCSVSWCERAVQSSALCSSHYMRKLRGTDLDKPFRNATGTPIPKCSVRNCSADADCAKDNAVCASHRNIYRKTGNYHKRRAPMAGKVCSVYLCESRATARYMCAAHNARSAAYGLTAMQFDWIARLGACAICGSSRGYPVIDHDHACCPGDKSCGDCIRGALCSGCNLGLGAFRDNAKAMANAIEYLKR